MARQNDAEVIALQALGHIAGDDELMGTFLGATGASLDDLRSRSVDPVFLGSVLDFLLMEDAWVRRFCDAAALPYTALREARQALPGGADVNWT